MMSPEHQRQNANDDSRQHSPVVQTRIDALIPRFYYFPDLFPYSHKQCFEYVAKIGKKNNKLCFVGKKRRKLIKRDSTGNAQPKEDGR